MLCSLVLCSLVVLGACEADIITSDTRGAAKRFQNVLTQQSLQTVLFSIEERLRTLDSVYSMQYSPSVEGKLEIYGRKLENVEAKISRLEAVMGNELDKISENISSGHFKDDLVREQILRKMDSVYERISHRLIFAETKMELIERKLENKLDTVLSAMEKMEDSLEIKDADMQDEIEEVLTCMVEIKSHAEAIEHKLNNVSKTLHDNVGVIQSDETTSRVTNENITATVRRDMKENFEVLSNKIVDFHETSWKTYDRLERTMKGMSLVSNLTRYEIQNGLRSLTVEVGRLSGGQVLLSDSSTQKSKLYEIDKKIDSNFESLMLAQNLFMENCYRLQKDEPQLETKISEVLDEMINTFNAKTAVGPRDIKKLEQTIKNHDQGVKNGFKNLGSVLQKIYVTDRKFEEVWNSVDSIKTDLTKITSSGCKNSGVDGHKIEEAITLLKEIRNTTDNLNVSVRAGINSFANIDNLQQGIEELVILIRNNSESTRTDVLQDSMDQMKIVLENVENKTSEMRTIFNEYYTRYFKLFLDNYAESYMQRILEIFSNYTNRSQSETSSITNTSVVEDLDRETIETIKSNCFDIDVRSRTTINSSILNCAESILSEDVIQRIRNYCSFKMASSEEDCLRNAVGLKPAAKIDELTDRELTEVIKTNCFPDIDLRSANFQNFECLQGILSENDLEKVRNYCIFLGPTTEENCLRNITTHQDIDLETVEIIKSRCFPQFDIRTSENASSFDCLEGVLNKEVMERIKNYCSVTLRTPEDACLGSINSLKPINVLVEEFVSEDILRRIENKCFPKFDIRDAANSSISECLEGILKLNSIGKINNFCSTRTNTSGESCLRYLIGTETDPITAGEIDNKTKEMIRSNCFPEIDLRLSTNSSVFECLQGILVEDDIRKIKNYCSLNRGFTEENCLRNLTGMMKIQRINKEDVEIIRSNCLSSIDVRFSANSSDFNCLKGILSDEVIESVREYCRGVEILVEEDCLRNITTSDSIANSNNFIELNDATISGNSADIIKGTTEIEYVL